MIAIKNILKSIDGLLTRWSTSYIHKVSRALYPRPDLEDEDSNDDDNDEPFLFI